MDRAPIWPNKELKRGTWSLEEDRKLSTYVLNHSHGKWRDVPKLAGLNRSGKSVRVRWMNYLRPDIKRGNFTEEEDQIIIKQQAILGNKWSIIAASLRGRTGNEIRNHWRAKLVKQFTSSPVKNHKSSAKNIERTDENTAAYHDNNSPLATNSLSANDCASAHSCIGTVNVAMINCSTSPELTHHDHTADLRFNDNVNLGNLLNPHHLSESHIDWSYDNTLADNATSKLTEPVQETCNLDKATELDHEDKLQMNCKASNEEKQIMNLSNPAPELAQQQAVKSDDTELGHEDKLQIYCEASNGAKQMVNLSDPAPAPELDQQQEGKSDGIDIDNMDTMDGALDPETIKVMIDEFLDQMGIDTTGKDHAKAVQEIEMLEHIINLEEQQPSQNFYMAWWIEYLRAAVVELKINLNNKK